MTTIIFECTSIMTRDKTSALILNIVVLINIYDMRFDTVYWYGINWEYLNECVRSFMWGAIAITHSFLSYIKPPMKLGQCWISSSNTHKKNITDNIITYSRLNLNTVLTNYFSKRGSVSVESATFPHVLKYEHSTWILIITQFHAWRQIKISLTLETRCC